MSSVRSIVIFCIIALLSLSLISLIDAFPSRLHRDGNSLGLGLPEGSSLDSSAAGCNASKHETEGPYWVEEDLNRWNLTIGTAVDGMPLWLKINVYNVSNSNNTCEIIGGAKVDIWHADVSGLYSDEQQLGTQGQKWLRGHQLTDAAGAATFFTWWPGWYNGRTVHIHVRIRLYQNGRLTYDETTQAYFDDGLTDVVYTTSPYNKRSKRSTTNRNDNLYLASQEYSITGSNEQGYVATASYGVPFTR